MSKLGDFDFSEFKQVASGFQSAIKSDVISTFVEEFLIEMAYRAERKIKKRTPVGVYKDRLGGNLRRNWQVGKVEKQGDSYIIEIYNNTEYASYVEFGHRTRDHKGWVEGRFMATISMQEIERELPMFLEKKQMQLFADILNGKYK
jgi:hypothetical protein